MSLTMQAESREKATTYQSVANTCGCLVRAFQLERGLVRALGGWLAGVQYWDAKLALGDHLWEHARGASVLLARLHELKETSAERQESEPIARLLRVTTAARDGDDFLWGMYGTLMPFLSEKFRQWAARIDPVMDPFSRNALLGIAERTEQHREWFNKWTPLYTEQSPGHSAAWSDAIAVLMGRIDWEQGTWMQGNEGLPHAEDEDPSDYHPPSVPRRDACFRTAYVNEVARRAGESFEERRLAIFYNHTQEMQFAESLGAILHDTPEMPWAFHHDLARHCADEIRHTRMGCTRLEQLGDDLRNFPMLLQNYALRSKLDPMERFCMMTLVIEASSFDKKRSNVKLFAENGDTISERYESYDIRDEMMHVNFGHTWVPIMLRVAQDPRSVTVLVQHCRDVLDDALKDERRVV